MKEHHGFHYRGPELSPEEAHGHVVQDLRVAAHEVWTPGIVSGTFVSSASVAGRELAAQFPDLPHVPDLTVAVQSPSRRMCEAISHATGLGMSGDIVTMTIPATSSPARHGPNGVTIKIEQTTEKAPLFTGCLDYDMFLQFMDRSGLCQKINYRQRMGRWVLGALEQYMHDQAAAHEAGVYRYPPTFGPW